MNREILVKAVDVVAKNDAVSCSQLVEALQISSVLAEMIIEEFLKVGMIEKVSDITPETCSKCYLGSCCGLRRAGSFRVVHGHSWLVGQH